MTRFVGDAVGVRAKARGADSSKQMKRNLERFVESGFHPEIERQRQEARNQIPALPDLDINRPFVFLDIAVGNKPLGRLVIELFEDVVPVAANHFKTRCLPGSSAGLAGSTFHKLLPRYALHGGLNPRAGGVRMASCSQLRAVDAGAVAVSLTGEEVVLALARALELDRTHQVVGRVHKGMEHLELLGDLATRPDDTPVQRVSVTRCGATNHTGNHEELEQKKDDGPPKDMATRLQEASAEARESVMDALQEGLRQKRKADGEAASDDEGGPSTSGAAAAGAGGARGPQAGKGGKGGGAGGAAGRNVKAKMLDEMLGDLGDDSNNDSDSEGGEGGKAEGSDG